MSDVVLEGERVKGVFCHNAGHPSCLSMLASYRKLLLSAYGPKGNSVLISNAVGREALVSSSSEIVKELSFAHPTTKYINALISAQNSSCGLNGLYTGLLCVGLLEGALKCEEEMPHPIVSSVSDWIISQLVEQLDKFPPQVVMELDIGEMDQVVSFVKTIIGAKSCLGLTKSEASDLSISIVRAFLKSIPGEYAHNGFGHVSITTQEEGLSSPGAIFEGMLYRNLDVSLKRVEEIGAQGEIRVLLFTVALSYTEETTSVVWGGPGTKEDNFGSLVLTNLMSILKMRNISIIANQKSVHPVLKFELERVGCVVLERLGTSAAESLIRVSGCRAVSNLNNLPGELSDAVLGTLTSAQNVFFNNKNYILLDNSEGCVSTLLLPTSSSPSILPTLKETAESCIAALRMAVVDGRVVCGGGCLEAWAATTVTHLITTNAQLLFQHAGASPYHIFKVGNIFVRTLMELALYLSGGSSNRFDWSVDTVFHHLWHTPPHLLKNGSESSTALPSNPPQHCVCGLVTQDVVRYKYNGWWKPVEFRLSDHLPAFPSQQKKNGQKSCKYKSSLEVLYNKESESEPGSLGQCTEDSLEGCGNTSDEDVDSLEKTPHSLEEEIDSLEGKLESFDIEEYDSLEDILDRYAKPQDDVEECKVHEAKLEEHIPGALYDSFAAKFNATRLALEGFTQLLHIGQCIFDK